MTGDEIFTGIVSSSPVALVLGFLWWRVGFMHRENKEALRQHRLELHQHREDLKEHTDADFVRHTAIENSLANLSKDVWNQSAVLARLDERTKKMNGGK